MKNSRSDFAYAGKKILDSLDILYKETENFPVHSTDKKIIDRLNNFSSLPREGSSIDDVLNEVITDLFKNFCNVNHPKYFGYISPRPLGITVLGELLASGTNQTPGAFRAGPYATVIEKECIKWISEFINYPVQEDAVFPNGIITSGGSMANVTALKLARDAKLGKDCKYSGIKSQETPVIYTSNLAHFSIDRSIDLLGIGTNQLRKVSCDNKGSIKIDDLLQQIQEDKIRGYKPLCIVGIAGTSCVGGVDNLSVLSKISKQNDMWFHVDAAAGGAYGNVPETKCNFIGIELADSVTIDPCKWLFTAFGFGCLLVKEPRSLYESFKTSGNYWEELQELDIFQMSFACTRPWRSLGLWMAFKLYGSEKYYEMLKSNYESILYFANLIKSSKFLEIYMQPKLPICCFKIKMLSKLTDMNSLNTRLLKYLYDETDFYLTQIEISNVIYLRLCISNYLTDRNQMMDLYKVIETFLHKYNIGS